LGSVDNNGGATREEAKRLLRTWVEDAVPVLVGGTIGLIADPLVETLLGKIPGLRSLPGGAKSQLVEIPILFAQRLVRGAPDGPIAQWATQLADRLANDVFPD
jgi:hypothetical protein